MKRAVIIVGSHFSGKSKTINKYFKSLIGLSEKQRNFNLHNKSGTILSQSIEEKKIGVVLSQSIEEKKISEVDKYLANYLHNQWLVLAARPENEEVSHLEEIISILKNAKFNVVTIDVVANKSESFYEQKAKDALSHLSSVTISGAA